MPQRGRDPARDILGCRSFDLCDDRQIIHQHRVGVGSSDVNPNPQTHRNDTSVRLIASPFRPAVGAAASRSRAAVTGTWPVILHNTLCSDSTGASLLRRAVIDTLNRYDSAVTGTGASS